MTKRKKVLNIINPKYWFLDFARLTGIIFLYPFFRPKCYYEDKKHTSRNIRRRAIIICNHRHWYDGPVLVILFILRRLHIIAAKETFDFWLSGLFMRGLGAYPIERDKLDMACFRKSVDFLKNEKVLLIFPEGHLQNSDAIAPFKSGITLIAIQGNAPIIPIYIKKKNTLFGRQYVMIGKSIIMNDFLKERYSPRQIEDLTKVLEEKMLQLKNDLDHILEKRS